MGVGGNHAKTTMVSLPLLRRRIICDEQHTGMLCCQLRCTTPRRNNKRGICDITKLVGTEGTIPPRGGLAKILVFVVVDVVVVEEDDDENI